MIAILSSPLGRVLGALAVAASLMGLSWLHGHQRGAASERQAILQRAVEAYQSREEIDNEVGRADLIDICIALGGVRDDCASELRRLEAAAEGQ